MYYVITLDTVSPPHDTVAAAEAWARAHTDGLFGIALGRGGGVVAQVRAQLHAARRSLDVAVRLAWAQGAAEASARADRDGWSTAAPAMVC